MGFCLPEGTSTALAAERNPEKKLLVLFTIEKDVEIKYADSLESLKAAANNENLFFDRENDIIYRYSMSLSHKCGTKLLKSTGTKYLYL